MRGVVGDSEAGSREGARWMGRVGGARRGWRLGGKCREGGHGEEGRRIALGRRKCGGGGGLVAITFFIEVGLIKNRPITIFICDKHKNIKC